MGDRPRGYGPADALTLSQVAEWARCSDAAARRWLDTLGVEPLRVGRWPVYVLGDILAARARTGTTSTETPPPARRAQRRPRVAL